MKKNNKFKIGVTMLILIAFVIVGIGLKKKIQSTNEEIYQGNQINLSINSTEKIEIKQLTHATNDQGQEVISFNFNIYPQEANDQSVLISLKWIDEEVSESIDNYLHYERVKYDTIAITCLKRANYQAQMTIASQSNKNVQASIKIDFNKQFQGFKTSEIRLIREIESMDNPTISLDEVKTAILNESQGFGDGTRYSAALDIQKLVIRNDHDNHTFLNDIAVLSDDLSQLMREDIIIASQFLETLSTCSGKSFYDLFINSDAENALITESIPGRDEIANFNYLTFSSKIHIDFEYYGEDFTFSFNLIHMVKTSLLHNYLFIPVSSITIEIPNIVF